MPVKFDSARFFIYWDTPFFHTIPIETGSCLENYSGVDRTFVIRINKVADTNLSYLYLFYDSIKLETSHAPPGN